MPEILTTSATISCQHGGRAILSSSQRHIFVNGEQVLIQTDVHKIVPGSCPYPGSTPLSPCVKIKWSLGSRYSRNKGTGLLTKGSIGKCYNKDGIFQGQAIISSAQQKVLTNG